MTDILTIHLPVPVPVIKTIPRWRVFLALFNPRTHFTTCAELQHQLYRETESQASAFQRSMKAALDSASWRIR